MREGKCIGLISAISGKMEVFLIADIRLLKYNGGTNSVRNSESINSVECTK